MTASVEMFLEGFFGEGNELSTETLAEASPELSAWLDERTAALRSSPTEAHVLPRRVDGVIKWYGLAHSNRQLRELTQALGAFMVPAFARLDRRATLNPADPVESAVLEFTTGYALAVEVLPGQQQQVRRALELFSALNQERPHRELALSRPLGRLLREFEMAVLATSGEVSLDLLGEIEESGQLSAQNLVFLRIRRLSGLRRFADLLQIPELATVLAIRRPTRVSASLLDAVYATELAEFEAKGDPSGALESFTDVVLRRYPALFRSRHGLQTPAAIKIFVLHSVAVHPGDVEARQQLLAAPDLRLEERQFLQRVTDLLTPVTRTRPTMTDASDAARTGDFDGALLIARGQPASVERAEILIRCAVEIDSLEAMSAAAGAVADLPIDERTGITTSRWYEAPWGHIVSTLAGGEEVSIVQVPTSWPEWFQLVVSGERFDNAQQIAERAVVEWAAESFSSDDSREVAHLLSQDLNQSAARLIKESLPSFLQFLDRSQDLSRHRDLLDDISTLLLIEEELGVADVQVLVDVVGTLLEAGISPERCRQIVEDFTGLWARIDAPAQLDNAIDMFDTLLTFGSPDPSARDSLLSLLLAAFQRWRRRVRPDQWALLEDLGGEVGAEEAVRALRPPPEDDGESVTAPRRDALAGKIVAIYTLTEPAGVRAREFLLRSFDDVDIEVSHDHVASDRLRALARAADVFVVATRSAKHAATTFIEAERPAGRPIHFAAGKGSASLIRAVLSTVTS